MCSIRREDPVGEECEVNKRHTPQTRLAITIKINAYEERLLHPPLQSLFCEVLPFFVAALCNFFGLEVQPSYPFPPITFSSMLSDSDGTCWQITFFITHP